MTVLAFPSSGVVEIVMYTQSDPSRMLRTLREHTFVVELADGSRASVDNYNTVVQNVSL